ncbi:asparagine synthase (glutamine-hydrolyzing) [Prochlorococcus marinus]|uniref:asparagine synthase (glutamine-hydrolyzing) n=1 Tax=Prochlorococcus marinus TaxID=1219 RepID=UPI0039AED27B
MCGVGLVKFYQKPPASISLSKCEEIISSQQSNRGPDNNSAWYSKDNLIMLCHQRLKILDTSNLSNQPFENEDLIGSFNGEIYNYIELGKRFYANKNFPSDTILLKSLLKKDNLITSMSLFDGPFSIILINKLNGKVFLARDSFGEKPLFYYQDSNFLIVASMVKSIIKLLKYFSTKYEINENHLENLTQYGFGRPQETCFKKIISVKKGCYANEKLINNKIICFPIKYPENFSTNFFYSDINEITRKFKSIFEKSVEMKLRSDVPIGIFLSGGLDSSLVAAYANKIYTNKINNYTIDFDLSEQTHFRKSSIVAESLGAELKPVLFTAKSALSSLSKLSNCLTSLSIDPAQMPLLVLSKLAAKDVTVCLSGDGADELFGGYLRYSRFKMIEQLRIFKLRRFIKILSKIKPFYKLTRLTRILESENSQQRYLNFFYFWNKLNPFSISKQVFQDPFFDIENDINDPCIIDQSAYLPEVILSKTDSCSMFHSLETRLPFLSLNIREFANKLRASNINVKKQEIFNPLLKYYLGEKTYSKLSSYKKVGLTTPLKYLFSDIEFQDFASVYLNKDILKSYDFFNTDKILFSWDAIKNKQDYSNSYGIWSILTLLIWLDDI